MNLLLKVCYVHFNFVDQETTEFAHNCISHHFYNPLTQQRKFQKQLSRVLFLDIRWHCNRQSLRTRMLLISPDIIHVRFANGYKLLGYSLCCSKDSLWNYCIVYNNKFLSTCWRNIQPPPSG